MEDKKIKKQKCPHLAEMRIKGSKKTKCEICGEKEHLRLCTSCGAVHCCESYNAHNTEHYKKTKHPIIKPVGTNYDFIWCYKCKAYLH